MKGHAKETCYKIVGYPANFKYKKRGLRAIANTAYNMNAENYNHNIVGSNA